MEQHNNSSMMSSLIYGLILGIALIAFSMLMFIFDVDNESWITWFYYVIMAGGLFLAMYIYRESLPNRLISFGTSFGIGFKTILFASILITIFTYIFVSYIDLSVLKEMVDNFSIELDKNEQMSEEDYDKIMGFIEDYVAIPITMTGIAFLWNIAVGTFFSLIIAIFVKREGLGTYRTPGSNDKNCVQCGKVVPPISQAHPNCPHCGALWDTAKEHKI